MKIVYPSTIWFVDGRVSACARDTAHAKHSGLMAQSMAVALPVFPG
jgi:hypothetical protein